MNAKDNLVIRGPNRNDVKIQLLALKELFESKAVKQEEYAKGFAEQHNYIEAHNRWIRSEGWLQASYVIDKTLTRIENNENQR